MKRSEETIREMAGLLERAGYDPAEAEGLANEGMLGMGPEELRYRLTFPPGTFSSLTETHGLKHTPREK